MKNLVSIIASLLLLLNTGYAQYKELSIGDTVPDFVLRNVYNHDTDTLCFSDLRGRLVILDFWNTTCLPCLKAFPKVDSLQCEFSENVQFLAVSSLGLAQTATFFDTRTFVHRPNIPFVTGDTVLHQLFPHVGVPYYVWIDSDGVVRHLTRRDEVTEEKLTMAIAKQHFSVRNTVTTSIRETLLDTAFQSDIAFGSYLVRHNSTKNLWLIKPLTSNCITLSGSVQVLYQFLYSRLGNIRFDPFQPQRTQLEARDKTRYSKPPELRNSSLDDWMDRHHYHYQCRVPDSWEGKIFDAVKTDFERYFPLRASIEKRSVDCLVLVRVDSVDRLASKGGPTLNTFFAQDPRSEKMDSIRHYLNGDFSWFSRSFGVTLEHFSSMPFFDETDYHGNVDISFSGESLDNPTEEGFQFELRRYGLDLVRETRRLDVLVLRDP
ncbi:TlpA family protein disulfide reductase [Parapedobacter deserti]|uniref:TlpA family protein disulfide reductase n=1 Tax=Parapedobacter deserti TaxID=1912957 RepID=A0ABV7JK10_9SPHI